MGGLCLKRHEVEADFRVHPPLHPALQKGDHQLAGGADDGPVQVPAEDPALLVADAHMEMTIGLVLLGGEGAVERDDLIFSKTAERIKANCSMRLIKIFICVSA